MLIRSPQVVRLGHSDHWTFETSMSPRWRQEEVKGGLLEWCNAANYVSFLNPTHCWSRCHCWTLCRGTIKEKLLFSLTKSTFNSSQMSNFDSVGCCKYNYCIEIFVTGRKYFTSKCTSFLIRLTEMSFQYSSHLFGN